MPGISLSPVQVAIYSILANDATLQTLLGTTTASPRIFDAPSEDQPHPYIVIGDGVETPRNTLSASVARVDVDVSVYSRYEGFAETGAIMDRCAFLLDRKPLTISGYTHLGTVKAASPVAREQEGAVRRGITRFAVWTQQVSA